MRINNKTTVCTLLSLLVCATPLSAFEVLNEDTPAIDAFSFQKRNDLLIQANANLVDGAITSNPPGTTFYDRYLQNNIKFQSNLAVKPNIALRTALIGGNTIIRQKENSEPTIENSGIKYTAQPFLEVTYITGSAIELVAGAQYRYQSKYTETLSTTDYSSSKTFEPAGLLIPRAGIYKRASNFGGGVFFEGASKTKRTVTTTAFDDSVLIADDTVHTPPTIGIAARFKLGNVQTELDFAAVQSSENSPKTENGEALEEDHVKIRLSGDYDLGSALVLRGAVIHKTLSYADNGFITLDTIPLTTVHLKLSKKLGNFSAKLGLAYGYGYDLQSVQEFNAKYIIHTYGINMGLNLAI